MNRRYTLQTYIAWGLLATGVLLAFLLFRNQISDLVDQVQGQPPGKEITIRIVGPPLEKPRSDSGTSPGQRTQLTLPPPNSPGTTPPSQPASPESPTVSTTGTGGGPSIPSPSGGNGGGSGGGPSDGDPSGGVPDGPPGDGGNGNDILDPITVPACERVPQVCNLVPHTSIETGLVEIDVP